MNRFLLLSVILLLFCGQSFAQNSVKDPIQDYLFTRDVNKDPLMPQLQQLLVLSLDVNNDGKPVTFITFNGYGGHQGNYWTAYAPTDNGYQKVDDSLATIILRPDTFYVGNVAEANAYGLLAYHSGKNGGDLTLYQITNNQLAEKPLGSLDLSKSEDAKRFDKYFGSSPEWKGPKDHPVKELSLDDLRKAGYDVDKAIQEATGNDHPLSQSTTAPQVTPPQAPSQDLTNAVTAPKPTLSQRETPSAIQATPNTNWPLVLAMVTLSFGLIAGLWYFLRSKK